MTAYFEVDLLSKKEELDQRLETKQKYLEALLKTTSDNAIYSWVEKAFSDTEHRTYKLLNEGKTAYSLDLWFGSF